MKLSITIGLTVLLCAPAIDAAQNPAAPPAPALSGAWELDRQASSPAPAGLGPDAEGHGGHRGSGGGGGYGGHGGGHGGGGGFGGRGMGGMGGGHQGGPDGQQVDKEELQRMRDLAHEVLTPPTRLVINQDGPLVTLTDDEGHVRRFTANNKGEKHQLTSGTVDTKTQWQDGALTMEIEIPHGMKVSRRYELLAAGDARQLVVTTEVGGGGSGGSGDKRPPLKAVYDPVLAEQ